MALVVGAEMGGMADTRVAIVQFTKKPELADKHMARPPFAFLHSVIANIILNTGYQKHLYTREQFDHTTVKTKEAKIAWLQKIKDAGLLELHTLCTSCPRRLLVARACMHAVYLCLCLCGVCGGGRTHSRPWLCARLAWCCDKMRGCMCCM